MKIKIKNYQSQDIPSAKGFYMPAEWAPHEATWLSWPHNPETWSEKRMKGVHRAYFGILEALLPHEKVHVLFDTEKERDCITQTLRSLGLLSSNFISHVQSTQDVWIRDYGPTFVINQRGQKAWCKWTFNAWGNKYDCLIKDNEVFKKAGYLIPNPSYQTSFVLEGGSFDVNGEGACLVTEQCLLNKNRNPNFSRQDIENQLRDYLGIHQFIWLEEGIRGDDTDGHIDDIARFVNETTIVAGIETNVQDANCEVLKKNWEILRKSRDEKGRSWQLVGLPMPEPITSRKKRLPASYCNFYIANRVALVPAFGCIQDDRALGILSDIFSDRTVVSVNCQDLIEGLGAIHCITQQEPAPLPKE